MKFCVQLVTRVITCHYFSNDKINMTEDSGSAQRSSREDAPVSPLVNVLAAIILTVLGVLLAKDLLSQQEPWLDANLATFLGISLGWALTRNNEGGEKVKNKKPKGCFECGKPATLRCSRCKTTWYCSTVCQAGAWAEHQRQCEDFRSKVKQRDDVLLRAKEFMDSLNLPKEGKSPSTGADEEDSEDEAN